MSVFNWKTFKTQLTIGYVTNTPGARKYRSRKGFESSERLEAVCNPKTAEEDNMKERQTNKKGCDIRISERW